MVALELKPRVPAKVDGVALDPQPDWSFDALLLELNSIERRVAASPKFPAYTKTHSRHLSASKNHVGRGFVMQVEDTVSDSEDEVSEQSVTAGRHFTHGEIYVSDTDFFEDEAALEVEQHLMDKVGWVEGTLSELIHDHHRSVMEEVRNKVLELETDQMVEQHIFSSKLQLIEKYAGTLQEMDRRLGMQYQRKIAEALDDHLIAVQRDHEHRSQIEERRIRDDAAHEEAKRREKALKEEQAALEKNRAEAVMKADAERMEKLKVAELVAQRKTAEVAQKNDSEISTDIANDAYKDANKDSRKAVEFQPDVHNPLQSTGDIIKGAKNALNLEEKRWMAYKELTAKNEALGLGTTKEYETHLKAMRRNIKTISCLEENVRVRADELIRLISYSRWPQSISIAMFAEQIIFSFVTCYGGSNGLHYAYGRAIVLVTSQVPVAMDIIISELNKVCIYTVPKYIEYSTSVFKTKEAYCRAIGFQEDGKFESDNSYLSRLHAYMKLYGAIVQTEVEGFQNLHGHQEGWAWLARFLNTIPANLYTAAALIAFLEAAGFVLYRKYKRHFEKLLYIIARDFMKALDGKQSSGVISELRTYIESKKYLSEPKGWRLSDHCQSQVSSVF
ncbi:hypothetical protein DM860_013473 [Cuscuta australis]|uniref:mRNA export factor GLE1 n=1 Tax=Cuscuta australis TaxID=267555 RepID=A0A328CZA5_9ASTE|nr:hypothetical protein DM860_013473 [Cuscuta australis]